MNKKIALIMIPLLYNTVYAMLPHQNTNSVQTIHQQVQQQMNQQFIESNNQRTVNNCFTSGQPIPSSLISGMHPSQAAGAYIYNTNLACQKK